MTEPEPGTARRLWHGLRGGLESVVGRRRLDAFLDSLGFFRLRSWWLAELVEVAPGLALYARPDDRKILDEVFSRGIYAPAGVREDDVVVDAGAHAGAFSVWASRRCPRGRVIAFEPAPINRDLLRRNLARAGAGNVTVVGAALGAAAGTARLHWLGDFSMYTLDPGRGSTAAVEVPVVALDAALAELGVDRVGVLKIDVERSEAEVLKGAERTLASTREVIAEVSTDSGLPDAVRGLLERAGLRCSVVADDGGALIVHAARPGGA